MHVAAFDTRIKVWYFGDAAKMKPELFYIKDKKGPLIEDETEHAKKWAHNLKKTYAHTHRVAC